MKILNNRREQKRFAKFATVGAIGAVVDFLVFNFFSALIELVPAIAQALSFTAAVTSNFILNRNWTFPDSRSKRLRTQMVQYLFVNLIGLAIRTPVFLLAGRIFAALLAGRPLPLSLEPEHLAHNLALATAIGVVLLWNYFVNRRWTFGDVE